MTLLSCLPETVCFILVKDLEENPIRPINPHCVFLESCARWHALQLPDAQLRRRVIREVCSARCRWWKGSWNGEDGELILVCVSASFGPSREHGAVTAVHLCLPTNKLIIYGKKVKRVQEEVCHWTWTKNWGKQWLHCITLTPYHSGRWPWTRGKRRV